VLDNLHVYAMDKFGKYVVGNIVANGYAAAVSANMLTTPEDVEAYLKDPNASTVLASLVEFGTAADRAAIAPTLKGDLVELSLDPFASLAVQKVVECLEPGVLRDEMMNEFLVSSDSILDVSKSV
jgi:hypothetical protein